MPIIFEYVIPTDTQLSKVQSSKAINDPPLHPSHLHLPGIFKSSYIVSSLTVEVVFYEDGEPVIDGEPGDLKFRIRTAPHDVSELVQALVGFEKIKHLDEHLVDIISKFSTEKLLETSINTGITKPKEVRKFKGEGMTLHFSNKKGDLYVTFEVLG
ncbi:hypothetical protein Ddye_017094 [Dipteronia dyeriana]|uniref:Chaperone DnaJ C-terminal domain-containing protein n=1 Tax=Dipteronia dyeriana TaxID=168575 RepID=A0AAD9X159_9ROSI|nr:hypothetical protein Ddye_017094 [Dipteronia dyeriana]